MRPPCVAIVVLVASVAPMALAVECPATSQLTSFAEQYPELVAHPVWGAFFARGHAVERWSEGSLWADEKALPTTSIRLALPPPLSGNVTLRHRPKPGWWCAALRVNDDEDRFEQVTLELPLEATWRITRGKQVVLSGKQAATTMVFGRDEIVLVSEEGRSTRFPIDASVWAAPNGIDIERDEAGLPNFQAYLELLAQLGVGIDALVTAPAPWPRIALNVAVHRLVAQERDGRPLANRDANLALLATLARHTTSAEAPTIARWTRRLTRLDGTLGTEQAAAHVAGGTRELRINGRTILSREKEKTRVELSIPVPRSGLALVEVAEEAFFANGGITAVMREAAWIPLTKDMELDVSDRVTLHPRGAPIPGCLVVAWNGPPGGSPKWFLHHSGKTSGPHLTGAAIAFPGSPAFITIGDPLRAFTSARPQLWQLVPGTTTFTVDESGAISGAFDPVDRCRR